MDRCVEGRLYRHQPFPDDPHFERDVGECSACQGRGCDPRADLVRKLADAIYPVLIPWEEQDMAIQARNRKTIERAAEAAFVAFSDQNG